MLNYKDKFTKQSWTNDNSLFNLPTRPFTKWRILYHGLFWLWDGFMAFTTFDRVLRVDPAVPPDPGLFQLMFWTHLLTTMIFFYLYGYTVVPALLKQLVYYRSTKKLLLPQLVFVILATLVVVVVFNVYDYYLFSYAAAHYTPNPPYIERIKINLVQYGPLGVFKVWGVQTFMWAYNISYLLLPCLLRIIREAISWGVESIEQKEHNQALMRNQLQLLQYQINPHFLFNVFNTIYALIQRTNSQAAILLKKLSQLMRYTLYETNESYVPLSGELTFLQNYIEIEQSRQFNPDQITLKQTGDTQGFLIPPLLLVTFVENAFKHGINNSLGDGWVNVEITIQEPTQSLFVNVSNSVHREKDEEKPPGGVGLANAKKRLNLLFKPGDYSLIVHENITDYQVLLTIPLKRAVTHAFRPVHPMPNH